MADEKTLQLILNRLDTLISLQLETTFEGGPVPISFKIKKLSELGRSASEIASIVNKQINYITAILSKKRNKK